jgi:large subunit ribosomal protein L3
MVVDNRPNSLTHNQDIFVPTTIIECPPLKALSVRFYKKTHSGLRLMCEVFSKPDKELAKKISMPKKAPKKFEDIKDFDDLRLNVYTQPRLVGIEKKKPELFEIALGGSKEEKLAYAKGVLGKEIKIEDVFAEGQQIDVHAVTRAHGLQGPVKRFGVAIRQHKSEKTKRGPGSLGPWTGARQYRVAKAGQTGYHVRTERNKQILKISSKPEEINTKGGFLHYGNIKNSYILVKGSLQGTPKRLLRFTPSPRPNKKLPEEAPQISYTRK